MDAPSILSQLVDMFSRSARQAGDRMSGMMLDPGHRSVIPGMNEYQAGQNAAQGKPPTFSPDTIQALTRSLAGAGITVPAQQVFHGTPSGTAGALPLEQMGQKFGPQVGSPGHYVINRPGPANIYSEGAISEAGQLAKQGDYAPNVRPYMMSEHQGLHTNEPVSGPELDRLLQSIMENFKPAEKMSKGGTPISSATQTQNAVNQVQAGMIPDVSPGGHLRDMLSGIMGQPQAEAQLSKGGFKSIQYPGEHPSTAGDPGAQAFKVLDNSILQNLFDALSKKAQVSP